MWEINDYILIDFIEPGDVVQIDKDIVHVRDMFTTNGSIIIRGYDDEWSEDAEWEVDIDSILPVLIEKD